VKGYEYIVKSGDTIAAIVAAYQQSGVKVTVNQVLKANPAEPQPPESGPESLRPGSGGAISARRL